MEAKRKRLKIGDLEFENPFILAPMAGITDSPFRLICRKMGCGLSYSEMISAKGLYYNDKSTERLLSLSEEELPVAYQIFGSEPEMIAFAADKLSERKNCLLDINMGCPVPKVVKNGEGSALLKELDLAGKLMEVAVRASRKPVGAKIRIGWDDKLINAVETAKILESAGASYIAVHGRTREQYYSGKADWKVIAKVKDSVKIPVIGNGDIFEAEDAFRLIEETNVDFVMVARGALGNPWIFKELKALWEGVEKPEAPAIDEVLRVILWQLDMLSEQKGEYAAVREMRKHIGWYIKGFHGATEIRRKINEISNIELLRVYLGGISR